MSQLMWYFRIPPSRALNWTGEALSVLAPSTVVVSDGLPALIGAMASRGSSQVGVALHPELVHLFLECDGRRWEASLARQKWKYRSAPIEPCGDDGECVDDPNCTDDSKAEPRESNDDPLRLQLPP
jgi:hypothetical protein